MFMSTFPQMICVIIFLLNEGVLGQQHHHVIATHVKTAVCAMTFGHILFVSAKAFLLEATVLRVNIPFYTQG